MTLWHTAVLLNTVASYLTLLMPHFIYCVSFCKKIIINRQIEKFLINTRGEDKHGQMIFIFCRAFHALFICIYVDILFPYQMMIVSFNTNTMMGVCSHYIFNFLCSGSYIILLAFVLSVLRFTASDYCFSSWHQRDFRSHVTYNTQIGCRRSLVLLRDYENLIGVKMASRVGGIML